MRYSVIDAPSEAESGNRSGKGKADPMIAARPWKDTGPLFRPERIVLTGAAGRKSAPSPSSSGARGARRPRCASCKPPAGGIARQGETTASPSHLGTRRVRGSAQQGVAGRRRRLPGSQIMIRTLTGGAAGGRQSGSPQGGRGSEQKENSVVDRAPAPRELPRASLVVV